MDLSNLKQEFAKLHNEVSQTLEVASKESRNLSSEEKEQNDRKFARMDEIKSMIDNVKRLAQSKIETGDIENFSAKTVEFNKTEKFDAKKSFNHYLASGIVHEKFTIDSTSGSGVLIPAEVALPHVVRKNYNAFRAAVASRGVPTLSSSAMVTINVPVFDDDSQAGAAQSESATSQTVAEPTVTGLTLSPTLYTSKGIWMSNTSLLAPGFDASSYLLPLLQKRLDLAQEAAWATNVISNGTNGVTAASTSAITYAEILSWEHSLRPAYRTDAVAVVSDTFYKLIRGLVDDNHRPLIELNPQTMETSIHGITLFVSDNLEAVAANKTIGFIASAEALKIYDAGGLRLARFANYPARPDQVGFELFGNGDFDFVPDGLRTFKTAAS